MCSLMIVAYEIFEDSELTVNNLIKVFKKH